MILNLSTTIFIPQFMVAMLFFLFALSGCSQDDRGHTAQTLNYAVSDIDNHTNGNEYKSLFLLEAGMCFDNSTQIEHIDKDNGFEIYSDVIIRDCNASHDNEVFYTYDLPSAQGYKEDGATMMAIEAKCKAEYARYVGIDYNESFYEMIYLRPTLESWQVGDTQVLCYLYHPNGDKLTQSLKDSQQ